jgi:hypothetical protein
VACVRTVGGSCEHDNEISGSLKGREFIGQLYNFYFLKNDFVQDIECKHICWY